MINDPNFLQEMVRKVCQALWDTELMTALAMEQAEQWLSGRLYLNMSLLEKGQPPEQKKDLSLPWSLTFPPEVKPFYTQF